MKRTHVVHEFVQSNHAEPSVVFPLLCPVREAEWVPRWKYQLLHSNSGLAEPGCVFTTPNDNGVDCIWICAHHDPRNFEVGYTWVWPEMIATRLTIRLTAAANNSTTAIIRYEYTALSDAGDREVARFDRDWFESKMKGWEAAINHFLETGRRLEASAAWE
jgi:hypothetical protein